jgi:hypothetical protein
MGPRQIEYRLVTVIDVQKKISAYRTTVCILCLYFVRVRLNPNMAKKIEGTVNQIINKYAIKSIAAPHLDEELNKYCPL